MTKGKIIAVARNPQPLASYRLEREIQEHMLKRVLIGADNAPLRRHAPLRQYYESEFVNAKGQIRNPDMWESLSYDRFLERFESFLADQSWRVQRIDGKRYPFTAARRRLV